MRSSETFSQVRSQITDNIYFSTKVTRDLKSKYKSLKGKQTHTIYCQKQHFRNILEGETKYSLFLAHQEQNPFTQLDLMQSQKILIMDNSFQYFFLPHTLFCYSHAIRETDSLRRTMQIVECSLLRRRAQGRVSSQPRTPSSICENLLYPKCTCPNPPPQIP